MGVEDFPRAVGRTAGRFGMELSRPLLLVSGGPDSVAMLRALAWLDARPVVLHVDHGLRGEESTEDATFVEELCAALGVACEVRRVHLGGSNLQEKARQERYRLAEELASERGLSAIATGHTADDVAETLLLNLARGAGLRGLAGIPPVRGRVVRPLIERRRTEVLAFLDALGQRYRTDATNLQPKYARNRVRLEVLPVLEDLYPGAGANIARSAALLRIDLEALERLAEEHVRRRGDEVFLSLADLARMPQGITDHAVRRAYAEVLPRNPPLGAVHVEAVRDLMRGPGRSRSVNLPGGVVAVRRPDEVVFRCAVAPSAGKAGLEPGSVEFAGWKVDVREVDGFDAGDASRPEVVYLDGGAGPYGVRMAREGDSIRPLGLGGTKKVMRAMMDRGVPRDLRRRTPVVVDRSGTVAWVCMGEVSEDHKVGEATERVLRVEVEGCL